MKKASTTPLQIMKVLKRKEVRNRLKRMMKNNLGSLNSLMDQEAKKNSKTIIRYTPQVIVTLNLKHLIKGFQWHKKNYA
jgi:RNase P protein component